MLSRFDAESRIGKDIFTLVPAVITKETSLTDLASRLLFWEIDIPSSSSLLSELKLWKQFWVQKAEFGCIPDDLASCLLASDRDIYPNISALITIGCTLKL